MKQGKLYGIGVGPGDPELMTVKAVRLLREADVIAVPDRGSGAQTALKIAGPYLEGREPMHISTPMIRDLQKLDESYTAAADRICALLEQGKDVAFLTLGDPTVYSTYIYIHQKVVRRGFAAELVPGVPSFCAVAAQLGQSLCERRERLMIVPGGPDVEDVLEVPANKVFMKSGSAILQLQDQLRQAGLLDRASAVENCGMEGERVWEHFGDMTEPSGYFCVVLLKP